MYECKNTDISRLLILIAFLVAILDVVQVWRSIAYEQAKRTRAYNTERDEPLHDEAVLRDLFTLLLCAAGREEAIFILQVVATFTANIVLAFRLVEQSFAPLDLYFVIVVLVAIVKAVAIARLTLLICARREHSAVLECAIDARRVDQPAARPDDPDFRQVAVVPLCHWLTLIV